MCGSKGHRSQNKVFAMLANYQYLSLNEWIAVFSIAFNVLVLYFCSYKIVIYNFYFVNILQWP